MALDESLLEDARERGVTSLRLYRWSEPTVSLGYFQKPEESARDPRLAGLPVVQRLSGGGAILHHHEWTYSCAVPGGHRLSASPFRLYDFVHERIIAWLTNLGIPARMRGETSTLDALSSRPADEPFLCFSRGDPRDIILYGFKIVGSAQRRRRGSILQHGSLLLRASPYAPQFPGLVELSGMEEIERRLPNGLIEALAPLFESSGTSPRLQ